MKQNCTIEVEKCTISYKGIKLGELFTITTKIKKIYHSSKHYFELWSIKCIVKIIIVLSLTHCAYNKLHIAYLTNMCVLVYCFVYRLISCPLKAIMEKTMKLI